MVAVPSLQSWWWHCPAPWLPVGLQSAGRQCGKLGLLVSERNIPMDGDEHSWYCSATD